MSFGHALYYPYIHLTNKNWLKHAFLFWDKISRIVPSSFEPQDDEDIIRIRQETNFLIDYHPDKWVINDTFRNFAEYLTHNSRMIRDLRHFEHRHHFDKEYKEMFIYMQNRTMLNGTYIHIEKIQPDLAETLYVMGLAIPGKHEWSSWIKIDNEIGALYMTYLAKSISKEKSIPIVTDTSDYYLNTNSNNNYRHTFEEKLGCLLIDVVMPKNINNVTMKQLINIRNKYDDQRLNFFNKINELSSTLPTIDNKSALEDALNHYIKTLGNDTKELKKIYESNGIEAMLKPLAISMPTALASLSSWIPAENKILGFGIGGVGALYGVVSYFNELDKRHRETQKNPMAYLLSIQSELNKKSLFQKIEQKLSGKYR
ncbi:MAG: DUF6236 family protein [Flavobacteriaceae bacterium]|nr:DUF6236 family protein [Flavobacteriaceae bacterium]